MTSCIFTPMASVFPPTHSAQNPKGNSLRIDKATFNENLNKTQAFCHWRMSDKTLDNATVFRSFNPIFKDRKLFEFQHTQFSLAPVSGFNNLNLAKWTTNPLAESIIEQLYTDQLANKNKYVETLLTGPFFKGDILISKIDQTLLDGASEFQSQGFFDTYDLPPIDTWFYMTECQTSRLIFAWVPQQYKSKVNQAILVNCMDCLGWFSQWYPAQSRRVLAN